MESEQPELLFFDTFSHDTSEELNLDLVQFTKTVCVTEIRVIPLGARVQADFPGGVRLGATNPSQFKIEFFVNDLSKPGASTFEPIGGIEYNQNGNIHIESGERITTDGLVLRGWYTTITLAVYGHLTKAIDTGSLPPQADVGSNATAEWVQHHAQPIGSYDESLISAKETFEGEWDQGTPEDKAPWDRKEKDFHNRAERDFRENSQECSSDVDSLRVPRGPSRRPRSPRTPPAYLSGQECISIKKEGTPSQADFDSLSPGDVESISEGEIPEADGEAEAEIKDHPRQPTPPASNLAPPIKDRNIDVEPFEPILSDEEMPDDGDQQFNEMEYDLIDYSEDALKTFNPYTCEIQPFLHCSQPVKTAMESSSEEMNDTSLKLKDLLDTLCSEHNSNAAREAWVHAAEQLATLLPSATLNLSDDVVCKISRSIELGLDLEEALRQPQPGYKLRQIKAGVRLVEVACQCGEQVTKQILEKVNIHQKLVQLYHEEYMALSIKLMILKSLDATLQCKEALDLFLKSGDCNGYNQLLKMVDKKPLARVQFAINSLLQKIHLYEVLEKLNQSVANLVTEERKPDEDELSEIDVETISNYLEEIIHIYKHSSLLMSHPKRFLPVSAQFEICPALSHRYTCPTIFVYFKIHKLLESFLILITHPSYSCYSSIVIPIYEMISCLQESQDGLTFLMGVPETINPLLKVLLNGQVTSEENEESSLESSSQIGLHLAYRLQALSHIDYLMKLYKDGKVDSDHPDVFDQLNALFCLTFSVVGKMSVVHVLSRDYISILINYYNEKAIHEETKVKQSPGKSFLADLITMTVKLSDHVPFLQKYSKVLLDIISKHSSEGLNDLLPWLKPVENSSAFSYDDISGLVEVIKQNIPENGSTLSGSLVTAVRVLKYLGIPPNDNEIAPYKTSIFEYRELKHKFVIIQLFSLEGVNLLTAVTQKICEAYEQPALHSARLNGQHGLALVSFFHPTLQLIRSVLTYVIKCRNVDFKDITVLPILLKCFLLMQAVPPSVYTHRFAQKVCRDIVETLLAFTQPIVTDLSSETEALTKSMWTLTVSEILKFTVATPDHFMPGLSLLSELLPLPLQVQTRSSLPEDEVTRIVNCRKLWSVHLLCVSGLIHELITTVCATGYNPLLQLLRSVCVQLADLAATTAISVTRAVLDSIMKSLTPVERPVTSHTMRLLTFLACLATHATIKAAILQLTMRHSTNDKASQSYPDLVVSLCHVLRAPHNCPTHIQAQECILSVVQSLCHCEVTLVPPPGMTPTPSDVYLANTLPSRDLLGTLILVMLEHVADSRSCLATVHPSLRTFLMLTEHDYGFFHLKNCLEKKRDTLWNVLNKFVSVWATERADTLSTLNTLLELLRGCLTPDAPDEVIGLPARVITMSAGELANMLSWSRHSEENKHPLYTIETLLQESRAEDETLETMCENVTELIRLLEEEGSRLVEPKDITEPLLPAADTLLAQFSARSVFVIADIDDGNLTASYWLSVPPPEDHDSEINQVACDLIDVALQELPDLQLADSVAALCHHEGVPGDLENGTASPNKRANSLVTDTSTQPFIAPMRGRGFRGTTQRGDMFRSRLPNTSRPPSLHVDDFVALETCGQQPTGPTGYNKSSMRAAQDLMATRARGGRPRPFAVDRGGRFFPTPYSRRDNGAGRDWFGEGSGFQSSDEMRGLRPSDPPHFSSCRPQLRGAPHAPWLVKDSRDRFSTSVTGSSLHQAEPNRNMRFFSR